MKQSAIPIALGLLIFCPPAACERWIERSDSHPSVAEG